MAYEKKLAVLYGYYEILSSYFHSYKLKNTFVERNLYLHFKDANNDFQYQSEDFAIYSIENILPKFIGDYDLNEYDAEFSLNATDASIIVTTKNFAFKCTAGFEKNKPSLQYSNVKTHWDFKKSGLKMEMDASVMDISED